MASCMFFLFFFFFFNDTATTEIYTLHIVGSVRCVQETGTWDIISVGITENPDKDFSIKVFPNPTKDFITVSIKPLIDKISNYFIELYDLQGKKLYAATYNQDQFNLDMISYPAGTFLLKVMINENKICLLYTSPSPRDQA
eukprot:TRINITY_DN12449_c0_g1_i2.p1 TRINITY_DN12449_c0_g1~~TRINITY_DN12449_c0_g1_i2.p1  ORF type:complete len:141 (-),score=44.25 TRINITY_DN12449_c0_g1_i2:115-537(-)